MLVLSIGRVIALPGVPYDPSIRDINTSHFPLIAICSLDLRGSAKLGFVRRSSRTRLGPKIQKVSGEYYSGNG